MLKLNRNTSIAGLLAALGAAAVAVPAHADNGATAPGGTSAVQLNTVSMLYKQWDNSIITKVQQKNSGSGYWDPQVTFDAKTGDIAVLASMSAAQPNNNGSHMQAGVGLLKLTDQGIQKVTELTQLPTLQGDRAFMRPTLALGSNFILALGASEDSGLNNGNPQVVAFILDRANGNVLPITTSNRGATNVQKPMNLVQAAQQTVNVNKNNQHGPHSVCALGPQADGSEGFIVGVQQNNNQAQVMKVLVKSDGAKATVTVPYLKTVINNARHNRVSLACPSNGPAGAQIVATSVEANQQPADIGVKALVINTADGTVAAQKLIAKSDNQNRIHAVQPTAAYISQDVVAIQYVLSESKGPGGNNNGHADNTIAQKSMLATFKVSTGADAFTQLDVLERPAAYQRHSASFGTTYGAGAGQPAVSILSGSSDGNGPGIQQVIPVDPVTGKISAVSAKNMYEISKLSDVAANCAMNMRDPGQARCYLNGMPAIANPGYQKANGFMPEVASFTLTAVGAKAAVTDNRLSLFVNLIPATWDPTKQTTPGGVKDPGEVPPGPSPVVSVPPDNSGTNSSGDPFGGASGDGTSGTGDNTTGSGSSGHKTGYGSDGVGAQAGGCSATSGATSGTGGLALLGLALAFLGIRRSKKES